MKWSWKIANIKGVEVRIHLTFFVLVAWLAVSYWLAGAGLVGAAAGVGFILAVFACVVLHEFGHTFAARQFGIRTLNITLLPIGGLARFERLPGVPSQEAWIALAGPAVNLAIVAVLDIWLTLMNAWQPFTALHLMTGPWIERLLIANVTLVLFNLIPAFPMDGGRVLRAVLSMRMGHARATEVAATLGQVLAIIMALVGLFVSPVLLFIALFVWLGATHEAAATRVRAALSNTQARAVMLTDFATLESGDTLAEAVRLTLSGSQRDFPVIDGGVVTGVLSRSDLLTALTRHGMDQPVTLAMRSEVSIAQASEMLDTVFARLQEKGAGAIPVVSGGLLVGLVTVDNVQEYLLIHATLEEYKLRTSGAAERPVKRNSAANS